VRSSRLRLTNCFLPLPNNLASLIALLFCLSYSLLGLVNPETPEHADGQGNHHPHSAAHPPRATFVSVLRRDVRSPAHRKPDSASVAKAIDQFDLSRGSATLRAPKARRWRYFTSSVYSLPSAGRRLWNIRRSQRDSTIQAACPFRKRHTPATGARLCGAFGHGGFPVERPNSRAAGVGCALLAEQQAQQRRGLLKLQPRKAVVPPPSAAAPGSASEHSFIRG
jgi:hypothetical protein